MSQPSQFEQLGADTLRRIITDFYDRLFDDLMIGFLFAGKDKQRLIDKEWELTARMLGGDVAYTGRSMPAAHASSPILGGHFARRRKILEETLADHHVDQAIRETWLRHTDALRAQVTKDRGSECDHSKTPQG